MRHTTGFAIAPAHRADHADDPGDQGLLVSAWRRRGLTSITGAIVEAASALARHGPVAHRNAVAARMRCSALALTNPDPLGNPVSLCELRFFAARSVAWLGSSRGVVACLPLLRCLFGLLAVLVRSDLSKDAELLVLRDGNGVLRRQLSGRLR